MCSNDYRTRLRLLLWGSVALFASANAWAFDVSGKSDAPVRVQADFAELDERSGTSIYRGNVLVQQGQSLIEANEIRIRADDEGIASFEASGEPAHMLLYDSEKAEETHAYAKRLVFSRENERVTLSGGARLQQEGSSFQGEEILYNTRTQIVSAQARPDQDSGGRVEIIYHPKKADSPQP